MNPPIRRVVQIVAVVVVVAGVIGALSYAAGTALPHMPENTASENTLYSNLAAVGSLGSLGSTSPLGSLDLFGSFGPLRVPTIEDLRANALAVPSADGGLRILIVPGHEPDYGGTNFRSARFGIIYERDLTAELGQYLAGYINAETGYHVYVTRTAKAWTAAFAQYFADNAAQIKAWEQAARVNDAAVVSPGGNGSGGGGGISHVIHNAAPADVALRLYGITKWANDNRIDIMIHIHINDYPGHSSRAPGKYSGLSIYVPAQQYANSTTTRAVADAVFKRLALYNPVSDLPLESRGVVDDPELIAIGAHNTSDEASMLIEYGYIYEPQFLDPAVRSIALRDLAYQTYLGLGDFLAGDDAPQAQAYAPRQVYDWQRSGTNKRSDPADIYALQTALMLDGDYPPAGQTLNECPRTGTFGTCTSAALKAFQAKHGIADEPNIVGLKSFDILSKVYSLYAR